MSRVTVEMTYLSVNNKLYQDILLHAVQILRKYFENILLYKVVYISQKNNFPRK